MTRQMTIEDAMRAGEEGMHRAAKGAEKNHPGWGDIALAFLTKWAHGKPADELWTGEDVTDAYRRSEPEMFQAKDDRAWGPIFQKAQRLNIIRERDREARRRKGHGVKGAARYVSLISGRRWSEIHALLGGPRG